MGAVCSDVNAMLATFMLLSVRRRVQGLMSVCRACSVRPSNTTHNPECMAALTACCGQKEGLLAKQGHVVLLRLGLPRSCGTRANHMLLCFTMSKITATSGMQVGGANQQLGLVDGQPGSVMIPGRLIPWLQNLVGLCESKRNSSLSIHWTWSI